MGIYIGLFEIQPHASVKHAFRVMNPETNSASASVYPFFPTKPQYL